MNVHEYLKEDGWKMWPNPYKDARCFFKRFDTPTRCKCNSGKKGIQVQIAVYEHQDNTSYEINFVGQLPDDTWVDLHNYGMPEDIKEGLKTIPRLLSTWEYIANH